MNQNASAKCGAETNSATISNDGELCEGCRPDDDATQRSEFTPILVVACAAVVSPFFVYVRSSPVSTADAIAHEASQIDYITTAGGGIGIVCGFFALLVATKTRNAFHKSVASGAVAVGVYHLLFGLGII